jgi:hypothetical protein
MTTRLYVYFDVQAVSCRIAFSHRLNMASSKEEIEKETKNGAWQFANAWGSK